MTEPLADTYGRVHRDLRISVTDRCNYRCTYCMPEEGMQWLPREEILDYEEIERLARVCVERFGVDAIRITGGEPTVRARVGVLVEKLAGLRVGGDGPPVEVAMTTNGSTLARNAHELAGAGLARVNVSLDSLRPDRFAAITRRDDLPAVLDGIDAALDAGLTPVKVNVVCMRGVNDDEVVDFARFGRERGVGVRFIEFMPLDAEHGWTAPQVVPGEEILERIGAVYPLEPAERGRGSAPAAVWRYVDGAGEVGVIPSVSEPFCADCDRIRLTAEGRLRNCLFALRELDLRALLRGGAADDELADAIAGEVARKWAGHAIGSVSFVAPPRSMSQIGG